MAHPFYEHHRIVVIAARHDFNLDVYETTEEAMRELHQWADDELVVLVNECEFLDRYINRNFDCQPDDVQEPEPQTQNSNAGQPPPNNVLEFSCSDELPA